MRESTVRKALEIVEKAHADKRLCIPQPEQRRRLSRAMASGLLVRPHPGIYATKEFWDDLAPERRILCSAEALATLHPSWVFAGSTAALLHGLSVGWSYLDGVCVAHSPHAGIHRRKGLRCIMVSHDKTTERSNLPVTSFLRTVFDCVRQMAFPDALAIADSALRVRGLSRDRLLENISRLYGRLPGARRVREVVALADGRAENGGESFVRAQMISLGFAIHDLQRPMPDPLYPGKDYRVDFAWDLPDGSMVIGELDGHDKYTDPEMTGGKSVGEVLFDERRREAHVTLADRPVRVMRFTLAEAKNRQWFEQLLSAYGVPRSVAVPEVARE